MSVVSQSCDNNECSVTRCFITKFWFISKLWFLSKLWVDYHKTWIHHTIMTEAGLWARACRWCKPGNTLGHPCLWDQYLAVELWQASASNQWTFGGQEKESPSLKRPGARIRLGGPGLGSVQVKRKSPAESIWHTYTWFIWLLYTTAIFNTV